jgi:hypothetical protein
MVIAALTSGRKEFRLAGDVIAHINGPRGVAAANGTITGRNPGCA